MPPLFFLASWVLLLLWTKAALLCAVNVPALSLQGVLRSVVMETIHRLSLKITILLWSRSICSCFRGCDLINPDKTVKLMVRWGILMTSVVEHTWLVAYKTYSPCLVLLQQGYKDVWYFGVDSSEINHRLSHISQICSGFISVERVPWKAKLPWFHFVVLFFA